VNVIEIFIQFFRQLSPKMLGYILKKDFFFNFSNIDYRHSLVSDIERNTCCAYQKLIIQMAEVLQYGIIIIHLFTVRNNQF
jgi:hypothetical protein